MVEALDHDAKVTTEQIEGTETRRMTCDSCDWMETAGSKSAATRKKNAHIADHRAATTGAEGVPTIMDAIEGDVVMPEGAFRDPVPVGDVEYLRSLREEMAEHPPACSWCGEVHEGGPENCNDVGQRDIIDPDDVEGVSDDPDHQPEPEGVVFHTRACGQSLTTCDGSLGCYYVATGEPVRVIETSTGWSVVPGGPDPDDLQAAEFMAGMLEEGGEEFTRQVMDDVAQAMLGKTPGSHQFSKEVGEQIKEAFHFPRIQDVGRTETQPLSTHTRTTTEAGPDFCHECSDEIQDWVPWPCPAMADRAPLAVALTRSRLAAQRGPSDADKDSVDSEWHKARANSVSATLAAKLGSAHDVDFLIAREVRERLNASRFWGNAYTRWGREREVHIETAAFARHGIEPESCLFHARANPRHTASPDGIGIHPETGDVRLGEYKTSGKELTWKKMVANGYYDQVQWQLYVLEASHAFLMWEWRHGEGTRYDTYVPEPGGEHLIMRDEERIAELVRRADRFLDALDAAREAETEEAAVHDPELLYLVSEHLDAKAAQKRAEETLREYCEVNGIKSLDIDGVAKVSYSFGSPRSTFDRERFEADHPGIYESYLKEGAPPERATLRVTPAKGDDEG